MTTQHSIEIFDLSPNTTYEYRIISRNYLANDAIASGSDLPVLSTTGFNITPGQINTTTTTAEINWATNLNASSAFVEYQLQRQPGDDPQSGTAGVSAEALSNDSKSHRVIIKGLRSNRAYTYKIKSISSDGYLTEHPTGGGGNFETFRTKSYDTGQFTLTPSSSNVAERNITSTNAQIVWQTALPTTSWVDFGTKSGIYDISAGNNDLVTNHVVVLDGLIPGERYYYRVRVKDANEVEYTSQEYTFKAVLKPKISNLRISSITPYSVTINWDTNIETETLINWGKTAAYGEKKGTQGRSKTHEIKVDGLEDNQEYHYQILARDEVGEEVADADKVVRTPIDTEGPKIEGVKTDILPLGENEEYAQVIISWKTNKPATTQVQYDEGIIGSRYDKSSIEDKTLSYAHTVIIKDLNPATTYRYRIIAKDKRENKTLSSDYNFLTPSKEKSILQLIIKSLEETFSWVKNIGNFFSGLGKKGR
jgi:phosphodiesterase/alkaline phosphatase D-like protein